jgi:biopolymer transport protein ExbD
MKTKFTILFVLLIVAVFTTACGSKVSGDLPSSAFSKEQAIEVATNALGNGYNNADLAAYARDLDDNLKSALNEDTAIQTQQELMSKYGKFISVEQAELTPAKTEGYVRWLFTCQFEKGTMYFVLVFPQEGTKAAGAGLYPKKPA